MKLTEEQLRLKAIALIQEAAFTTPEPIHVIGVPINGRPNPAPGDLTETKCDYCGLAIFSTRLNEIMREYTTLIHNPAKICCPTCMKKILDKPDSIAYHV
jgi:hypothetical protein